jgi:hypothetical protein
MLRFCTNTGCYTITVPFEIPKSIGNVPNNGVWRVAWKVRSLCRAVYWAVCWASNSSSFASIIVKLGRHVAGRGMRHSHGKYKLTHFRLLIKFRMRIKIHLTNATVLQQNSLFHFEPSLFHLRLSRASSNKLMLQCMFTDSIHGSLANLLQPLNANEEINRVYCLH